MRRIFVILAAGLLSGFAQDLDGPATAHLLERLAAYRTGKAIRADFVERRFLSMMKEPVMEEGTVAFEPPDKFLRRTEAGNVSVSNGKTLWMFYPAFQQAEKYDLNSSAGPGELFATLARLFQLQDLERHFRVTAVEIEAGYRLDLQPRSAAVRKMIRRASVDVDKNLRLLASVIESPGGDRTEATYSGERFVPIGEMDFEFAPPPGTQVASPGRR